MWNLIIKTDIWQTALHFLTGHYFVQIKWYKLHSIIIICQNKKYTPIPMIFYLQWRFEWGIFFFLNWKFIRNVKTCNVCLPCRKGWPLQNSLIYYVVGLQHRFSTIFIRTYPILSETILHGFTLKFIENDIFFVNILGILNFVSCKVSLTFS